MFRSKRVAKAILASVVSLLLTSCVGETRPFAYDPIEQSQSYISKEVLAKLVSEKQTREQVTERLGTPDEENVEPAAVGYERCVESKGTSVLLFFYPFWIRRPEVQHCQIVGIWFDGEGRAKTWLSRTGLKPEPVKSCLGSDCTIVGEDIQMWTLPCSLDQFLYTQGCANIRIYKEAPSEALSPSAPNDSLNDFFWLYGSYANAVELVSRNEPQDYVEAYKNFSIVVAMATDATLASDATKARDSLAAKMDAAQITEALRLANEWTAVFEKRQQVH